MYKLFFKTSYILILCFLLAGCSISGWEGFVSPDKNTLEKVVVVGMFDSLYECRAEAIKKLEEVSSLEKGAYECGYSCEYDKGREFYRICDDSSK